MGCAGAMRHGFPQYGRRNAENKRRPVGGRAASAVGASALAQNTMTERKSKKFTLQYCVSIGATPFWNFPTARQAAAAPRLRDR